MLHNGVKILYSQFLNFHKFTDDISRQIVGVKKVNRLGLTLKGNANGLKMGPGLIIKYD
jgi:hypothetical protein